MSKYLFKFSYLFLIIIHFRDKLHEVDSEQKQKAVFSSFSTGPRIAGFVYDKHLSQSMKNAEKRVNDILEIFIDQY